jgi:hypothetical protein
MTTPIGVGSGNNKPEGAETSSEHKNVRFS